MIYLKTASHFSDHAPNAHALVWWISGDNRLSQAAAQAIKVEMNNGEILISSISAWEIAMLVSRGRIALSMDIAEWLCIVGEIEAVKFMPVDNEIAVKSIELPGEFHKDPADRIIVATARKVAAPCVTADEKIQNYPHVRTIW